MAVDAEAYPVTTTTHTSGSTDFAARITSRPESPGRFRSVRMMSGLSSGSFRTASSPLQATVSTYPCAERNSWNTSTTLGSSSTTITWAGGPGALAEEGSSGPNTASRRTSIMASMDPGGLGSSDPPSARLLGDRECAVGVGHQLDAFD